MDILYSGVFSFPVAQAREGADDDIVQAVNHYTTALQDALRLVTTA